MIGRRRIKYLLALTILLGGPWLLLPAFLTSETKTPQAVGGVIDLRHEDFSLAHTIPLSGEWELYWDQLLTPTDFDPNIEHSQPPARTGYLSVPSLWEGKLENVELANQGRATYRLRIKVPPQQHDFGIKTEIIRVNSRLFVNGIMMGGAGEPEKAASLGELTEENVPYAAYFTANNDQIEVILQVANYAYKNGGIPVSIQFGSQAAVGALTRKLNGFEFGTFIFLCSGAFYHIGIFLFGRRREKSLLYFGLFCLCFAISDISLGQKVLNQVFPGITFVPMHKLRHIITALATGFMILFLRQILNGELPERFTNWVVRAFGIYALLIAFLPHAFTNMAEMAYYLATMSVYFVFIGLLARLLYQRRYAALGRRGLQMILLSFLCLWMYLVVNILYVLFLRVDYRLLGDIGLVFFSFLMSYTLAMQFATAYKTIETMTKQLQEQDKIKDVFLANTSHEFRTPLHGIIHMTQAVLETGVKNLTDSQNARLQQVVSLAQRLSLLVTDLLDFEKMKDNDLRLSLQPIDTCTAVDTVLEVVRHLSRNNTVELVNCLAGDLPNVYADENRLRQILYNVIGNAVKYTEHGKISITATAQNEMVVIHVTDSGIGIPALQWETIFQRFEQLSTNRAEEYGGTGLGLAITRQLIERMGGKIEVIWSEVGKGSTFALTLPAAKNNQLNHALPLPETVARTTTTKLQSIDEFSSRNGGAFTILAVDDDPINLQILVAIFAKSNYDILTAANGAQALAYMTQEPKIDLLLLDAMMPGMTGFEVCKKLREQYSLVELPILLVTARGLAEDIAAGFAAGANDYVIKPFNAVELQARTATLLSLKKAVNDAVRREVAFLQSQIKPHFFYNVLNTIISLCYTDSRKAGDLLAEFSNYLRRSVDIQEDRLFTTLASELEFVESYLRIEKARFQERLTVDYEIDASLLHCSLPPLLIQPLVENAVRHGLMNREDGGRITIKVQPGTEGMVIEVTDDGVGIPATILADLSVGDTDSRHIGLRNINRRLSNYYGAEMAIHSSEGNGTTILITVPLHCPDFSRNEHS